MPSSLLVRTANACGHPYQHPLTGISITKYSSAVKEESSLLLTGFIDLLTTIRQKLDVFSILLKDTDIHPTRKDFQTIAHIIRRILDIPELTPGLLTLPLLNETLNEYREVVVHGRKQDEQKERDRNRIHPRNPVHQRKADVSRMEPGIRSMVPSQIFRTAENQKGNQHICFKKRLKQKISNLCSTALSGIRKKQKPSGNTSDNFPPCSDAPARTRIGTPLSR